MGIIAFILVVGGAFGVVLRTGAIESGIMRVIDLTNGKEILLIPILITLFSLEEQFLEWEKRQFPL